MGRTTRCALSWTTVAATLAVGVVVTPAPSAAAEAWWCATDATLAATALPAVLPHSTCSVRGRAVVSPRGFGVAVPDVGHGVSSSARFTDGTDELTVWTDEYAVHVGGSEYDAALGYLTSIRAAVATGTGDEADLARMARAVRSLVVTSSGRVRVGAVPMSVLLDAADTVVAAFAGPSDAAAVLAATEVLDAQLRRAFATDESPALVAVVALADEVRAALRAGAVDRETAERVLAHAVLLRNVAMTHAPLAAESDGVGSAVPVLGRLVDLVRTSIGRDTSPDLSSADTEAYESALADLSDYLGRVTLPGETSLPDPGLPSLGDPADGGTSSASPHPCSDGARSAKYPDRGHWDRGYAIPWYYNHSNHNTAYTADGYSMKLEEAFGNITLLRDSCGYSWRPNIGNVYRGYATQTTVQPIDAHGYCQGSTDGKNIVGWKTLDVPTVLAWTCVFRPPGGMVNGFDIAIARNARWNIPEFRSCAQNVEYDFEAVLTHEFGHAVALGHVSEGAHGNLTMSELNNGPCTRAERTPGYGDAIGLAVLYTRA